MALMGSMPRELVTPPRVTEGNDFCLLFDEQPRRRGAGVAEALDGNSSAAQRNLFYLASFFDHEHKAASGGFRAPYGATDGNRLAGDNAWDGVAHHHGVRVHDPIPSLAVGINVGCRNIL